MVLSLHVEVQEDMCRVILHHGGIQGGTCPESGFSVCSSEKQKFAAQHAWSQFSSKPFPGIHAWLDRSPHLHQLCCHLLHLTPDLMVYSYYKLHGFPLTHQTSEPTPIYTVSDHVGSSHGDLDPFSFSPRLF